MNIYINFCVTRKKHGLSVYSYDSNSEIERERERVIIGLESIETKSGIDCCWPWAV